MIAFKQTEINNKINNKATNLLIKTKSFYGLTNQRSKPEIMIEKQRSLVALKPVFSLRPKVLLLSPEKTLTKTANDESPEQVGHYTNTKSKQIRKRNMFVLSKEREKWSAENKRLYAEREQSLEEINQKIDSLYSTQDELRLDQDHLEDIDNTAHLFQAKNSILNRVRAKRKVNNDNNKRLNTVI